MNSYLPKHLLEGLEVSPERAQELKASIAQSLDRHVSPYIVRGSQAMGADFVEWRGEGKYIYSPDGQRLFDCVGAGGVFALGYAHPDLVEALTLQLQRGGLVSRVGFVPGQAELADKLTALVPESLKYVYFANSGTEAIEAAIKLARLCTGKKKLIGTKLGYHGMSIGTISLSEIAMWRDGVGPFVEATRLVTHGDLDSLAQELDDDTAAVVLEPIQWASGCKVAAQDYFPKVLEMCRAKGALLILDEIQTGLGRTGTTFAFEHWGVVPDILCVGKILSGGMVPIAATMYTEQVQKSERMRSLFNNSSFAGNALACTAGITTLNLLEDQYLAKAKSLGEDLGCCFEELVGRFKPMLLGYHGLGLMRCLEFSLPLLGMLFSDRMRRDHNILVAAMGHIPQFVRISPPFLCDSEDIEQLGQAASQVLQDLLTMPAQDMTQEFTDLVQRFTRSMAELEEQVEVPR